MHLNINTIRTTEFGVVVPGKGITRFRFIPTEAQVKEALWGMMIATITAFKGRQKSRSPFDVADKHAATEYLYIAISDDLASRLRELHEAENIDSDVHALDDAVRISSYFVRFTDTSGRRFTAVRRASQFKGIDSKKKVFVLGDELRMVKEPIFQLNDDFDVVIDKQEVHILHPAGFRALSQIDQAVREGVGRNLAGITSDIPSVEWPAVQEYAERHPRAANLLSSIRTNDFADGVDSDLLFSLCQGTGVGVSRVNGMIRVPEKEIMAFLEVLDRRRYEIGLVRKKTEKFRAASRQRLTASRAQPSRQVGLAGVKTLAVI